MQQKTPNASAYDSGVRYLAQRAHSIAELEGKLSKKGFDAQAIELAVLKLQDHGYLNDQAYCDGYVQMRKRRGFGPVKIRQELNMRGLACALVEQTLQASDADWCELAAKAWGKKFARAACALPEKAKHYRFLQYRGFTAEQIQTVLN